MPVSNLVNRTPDTLKGGKRNYVRYVAGTGSPIGDTEMAKVNQFPVGSTYIDNATGNAFIRTTNGWMCQQGCIFSGAGAPAAGYYAANSQNIYPIGIRYYDTTNARMYTRVATANAASDWKYAGLT